jgi:fatty-acyl-CoA synthase
MGIISDKAVWQAETFGHEPLNSTIGELLDRQAEQLSNVEALVYSYPELGINLRLNYRQFRDTANRIAKGLLALGIQKGEHVAVWMPNFPQWIFLQMALAKIGAVLVTINTAYRQAELEYVLRQGDITTLFLVEKVRDNSYLESLYGIVPELKELSDPAHNAVKSAALPHFKRAILVGSEPKPGVLAYDEVVKLGNSISDEELQTRQNSLTPQDTGMIQYTSGTTGFPKGVQMTQYGMVNNARFAALRNGSKVGDKTVLPMPLFHVGGCVLGVIGCLAIGTTLIPLIAFDPVKQLELISQEQATTTSGVPTMLVAMLNNPRFVAGEFDLSSLRLVVSGGSPVPVPLMEQVKEKMGANVAIIFGMTEAAGGITYTLPDDSFELKSATVGLPLPHCDVKIVNVATGEPANLGEPGELWVRGYLTMQGYYNMPEKTAETLVGDGWLRTGDLATMNAQGYINIVGRVKDMIIRGGENIYPAEIEAFLMRHPKVAEAQVIGIPDSFMGEEIMAVLRLKTGETSDEAEIRDYCRANISHQKVPRHVRFVEVYPTNATGKVKKFELKDMFVRELGLEKVAATPTA